MRKIAMAVHGGAGNRTAYLVTNKKACQKGLKDAVKIGYDILERGGSALDAVEQSVISLEDNELFNAGRGSALNSRGEVEMDASIMDGKNLKAGAVSMVTNVKNPISLARRVMSQTRHVFLSGYGALEMAKEKEIVLEPDSYFLTEHQYQVFLTKNQSMSIKDILQEKMHGTVGAVAVDKKGNVAAATSTGGTANCLPGRIGDSCIIGAGCYANNKTCAISATGIGEDIIRHVIANSISMFIELKNYSLQDACTEIIKIRNSKIHVGIVAVNPTGDIVVSFNTSVMRCAWMSSGQSEIQVRVFRSDFK